MNSGIILVGDAPKAIHGTYHVFAHCTELDEGCQVQVSHFPDDEDSWLTIVEVDTGDITHRSAATIATLAGHVRVIGDVSAKVSLVAISGLVR